MYTWHAAHLPARDKPSHHDSVWLAPGTPPLSAKCPWTQAAVWFSAVVRGDVAYIDVGERVNIQDGAVIHGTTKKHTLEDDVGVGLYVVHGAHVKQGALIGMGAVVMDHAVVGRGAVVAAGAWFWLAHKSKTKLWAGVPANVEDKWADMQEHLSQTSARYVEYAQWFTEGSLTSDAATQWSTRRLADSHRNLKCGHRRQTTASNQ